MRVSTHAAIGALMLAVTACSPSSNTPQPTPPVPAPAAISMAAGAWTIGPVINGVNYSVGMPLHPTQTGSGFSFVFPGSGGAVNYVTTTLVSLHLTTSVTMQYQITLSAGAALTCDVPNAAAANSASGKPTLALFIQQPGDNWSAAGPYNYFRWYGAGGAIPAKSGIYTVTLPLTIAHWSAVEAPAGTQAQLSGAAMNVGTIGVTFGGCGGAGHGVAMKTGTATFTVLSFTAS